MAATSFPEGENRLNLETNPKKETGQQVLKDLKECPYSFSIGILFVQHDLYLINISLCLL